MAAADPVQQAMAHLLYGLPSEAQCPSITCSVRLSVEGATGMSEVDLAERHSALLRLMK